MHFGSILVLITIALFARQSSAQTNQCCSAADFCTGDLVSGTGCAPPSRCSGICYSPWGALNNQVTVGASTQNFRVIMPPRTAIYLMFQNFPITAGGGNIFVNATTDPFVRLMTNGGVRDGLLFARDCNGPTGTQNRDIFFSASELTIITSGPFASDGSGCPCTFADWRCFGIDPFGTVSRPFGSPPTNSGYCQEQSGSCRCVPGRTGQFCASLIPCPNNPSIRDLDISRTTCGGTPSGATCPIICSFGFTPSSVAAACASPGVWQTPLPMCNPMPCSNNPDITHLGSVRCEGTASGSSCDITCASGFTPSANSVTCTAGTWNLHTPLPTCSPSPCLQQPGTDPHLNYPEMFCVGTASGQSCAISCIPGYIPNTAEIMCAFGLWDREASCSPVENSPSPNASVPYAAIIGSLVGVGLLAGGGFWWFKRRSVSQKSAVYMQLGPG